MAKLLKFVIWMIADKKQKLSCNFIFSSLLTTKLFQDFKRTKLQKKFRFWINDTFSVSYFLFFVTCNNWCCSCLSINSNPLNYWVLKECYWSKSRFCYEVFGQFSFCYFIKQTSSIFNFKMQFFHFKNWWMRRELISR